MSFAENLKQLRKERQLSQEELAEALDVSRQAVSKWEQGVGYPEVEKLLLLSREFRISLDSLMATELAEAPTTRNQDIKGIITITSPIEHAIVKCHRVIATGKMSSGKSSPQYALFGASEGSDLFGNETRTFLGWCSNEDDLSKEIMEIHEAIEKGDATYTLKYSVRTKKRLLGIKIETE